MLKSLKYGTLFVLFSFMLALPAYSHKPSDSYITLQNVDEQIIGRWDIALRDLDYAIGLDLNGDGKITWGEVKAKHGDISNYALGRFHLKSKGEDCINKVTSHLIDNHSDGAYEVLNFDVNCEGRIPEKFDIEYMLFFDLDPMHRGLVNIRHNDNISTYVFSPEETMQHIDLNAHGVLHQLLEFLWEGIWHIWIGFDHILFLLALLLPAVFKRTDEGIKLVPDFKSAFWNVFKIVTAFTLAHSITLSLAALKVVSISSRLIESAIALSVLIAGLNNIFSFLKIQYWIIALLFGLIHGFGFANVLLDVGLPHGALLLALFGFNVGVELGQVAIVGVFLPFAYMLRQTTFYKNIILIFGSVVISIIALLWLVDRAFDLGFMPF